MTLGQFLQAMHASGCHSFTFRLDPCRRIPISSQRGITGESACYVLEGMSGDFSASWEVSLFDATYNEAEATKSVESIFDAHRKHTLELYEGKT